MDPTSIALLLLLGAVSGFAAGLLGIGGGILLAPFLAMFLTAQGYPAQHVVHSAVATSLATILFTSTSSWRAHAQRNAVLWPLAAWLSPGLLIGALLGAQLAGRLPAWIVAALFAVVVLIAATQMLLGKEPALASKGGALPGKAGLISAGSVIGLVSSFAGAGGGFLSVPFMLRCGISMHQAIGTSAALGFPIAAAGALGYAIAGLRLPGLPEGSLGFIYVPALLAVAGPSLLMAPVGAKVAHAMDTKPLKRLFALMLYVLAAYMLYHGIKASE